METMCDVPFPVTEAYAGNSLVLRSPAFAYFFLCRNHHLSVSSALMFGIGDDATLYNVRAWPFQQFTLAVSESWSFHQLIL